MTIKTMTVIIRISTYAEQLIIKIQISLTNIWLVKSKMMLLYDRLEVKESR